MEEEGAESERTMISIGNAPGYLRNRCGVVGIAERDVSLSRLDRYTRPRGYLPPLGRLGSGTAARGPPFLSINKTNTDSSPMAFMLFFHHLQILCQNSLISRCY